jgi:hypothetical protein
MGVGEITLQLQARRLIPVQIKNSIIYPPNYLVTISTYLSPANRYVKLAK